MIRRSLSVLTALALLLGGSASLSAQRTARVAKKGLSSWVNTLIGTDWVGNVYPGASAPFGMVQLSPDNGRAGWD